MVELFDYGNKKVIIRLNGGINKDKDEHVMEYTEHERP